MVINGYKWLTVDITPTFIPFHSALRPAKACSIIATTAMEFKRCRDLADAWLGVGSARGKKNGGSLGSENGEKTVRKWIWMMIN